MSFYEYFSRAYVVNLPERADRRKAITRELSAAGLAIGAGATELYPAVRPADAAGFPNIGANGCFQSHLGILRKAVALDLPNVVVMEDDLALADRFAELCPQLIASLKSQPWDLLYLGHTKTVPESEKLALVPASGAVMTTHFYAVNRQAIPRLIAFLELIASRPPGHPDGGPMHLDGAYSTFRQQNPDIVTLLAAPSLGGQRSSRSDIAHCAWYDRAPVFRSVAGAAREMKTWLRRKGNQPA